MSRHKASISQGKDGRWRTWVPDENCRDGRKQIARKTRGALEASVVEHYIRTDKEYRRKNYSLKELYPEWKEFKAIHTAETYATRLESDWKKYYANSQLVDKRIRDLTRVELDEWIHKLIREHNMTKTMYYNVSLIIRQCLDYAVESGIIEENVFRKVKVDSKRMFRKVCKKKDSTQVYAKDEVLLIFGEAWKDFRNSKRLVYRLAPLAVMFQFLTGLRIGELCAVKFADIENGYLNVSRMLQRDRDKVVEHTKSYSDRAVLLPQTALEIINTAKAYQDEHNCKSEFVFSTTKHPLSYREVNLLLRRYCERLDILYRSSHKSRKTYISSLIDAGININSVRSYAGHADERTTYSCYCYDRTPERFKKEQLERALSLE